jgi:hypothetical protein
MRVAVAVAAVMAMVAVPVARGKANAAGEPKTEGQAAQAVEVQGEVVAADPEARTLTLKVSTGAAGEFKQLALSVEGEAVSAVGGFAPGEHVIASCRAGTSGDACAVTAIRRVEPPQ